MAGFADNKESYQGGVEKAIEDSQFVDKILEVSKAVEDAIRRTKIADGKVLNDITKLYDYVKEFKVEQGLRTLKLWLDGQLSVGGYNFALATMGHARIPIPSAMGVHLSKEDSKTIREIAEMRERRQVKQNEEGETD